MGSFAIAICIKLNQLLVATQIHCLSKKKSLNNLTEIYIEKYDKKVKAYSITIKDEDI